MSTKKPKQTTSSAIPEWLAGASKEIVGEAGSLYRGSNYRPYQGDRVAGLSFNESQASQMAGDPNAYRKFMNPYIEGALDVSGRKLRENYQQGLTKLRGQGVSRGAFGGSRQTLLESGLNKNFNESLSDLYTQGMSSAFDRAQDASGRSFQQMMETGGLERGLAQANLDDKYNRFTEEQDYPWMNLDRYRSIISGVPYTTTQTSTGSRPDALGQAIGLGSTVVAGASLFSSKSMKDKTGKTKDVAGALSKIPVDRWAYKGSDKENIGPYAEDFNRAIGKPPAPTIDIVDGIGASIASVGELDRRLSALEKAKAPKRRAEKKGALEMAA